MLQQWKTVLRQAFIKTGHTLNFRPSLKQIPPQAQPSDIFMSFLTTRPEEVIVMGPSVLSIAKATSSILATNLRKGTQLYSFGDGTVKDGIGAHGWQSRPSLDLSTDLGIVELAAQSDGHPSTITSLRTKSLAVLAIMYYIRALCQYYSIPTSPSKIQYHFDNEEALRRLNTLPDFTNTANPLATDYDVWAALHEAAISTPCTHFGTHVKGHQDGTELLENLSAEAQLNVRMDEIAGTCRLSHSKPLKTRTHKGNNIVLEINGNIITSNMHNALRFEKTARPLQDYIIRKQGWDEHIFHMVD